MRPKRSKQKDASRTQDQNTQGDCGRTGDGRVGADVRLSAALGARGLAARFAASHFEGCGVGGLVLETEGAHEAGGDGRAVGLG